MHSGSVNYVEGVFFFSFFFFFFLFACLKLHHNTLKSLKKKKKKKKKTLSKLNGYTFMGDHPVLKEFDVLSSKLFPSKEVL